MKKMLGILTAVLLLFCAAAGCSSASSSPAAGMKAAAGRSVNLIASDEKTAEDSASSTAASSGTSAAGAAAAGVKLVYNADLQLETTDFGGSSEKLKKLTADLGGYFQSSNLNNSGTYRSASYQVRIPAEKYRSFCDQAGGICQVDSFRENVTDISETYYDTQSRLTTQQTKLKRLQDLLAKAEKMEDIISLESAISETESSIEELTGNMRKYDSLVGYSTVNITLQEVAQLSGTASPAIGFPAQLREALRAGLENGISGLQGFALAVAYNWLGWLIFLAIAAAVIALIVRNKKKAKRPAPPKDLPKPTPPPAGGGAEPPAAK